MRKKIIIILSILLSFSNFVFSQTKINCDYIIENTDVSITNYNASPGDTMCIMAGERPQLYLKKIYGSEDEPVVLINYGGQVNITSELSYGLKIASSRYLKVSGNGGGKTDEYGIAINSVLNGNGIHIGGKTSDIELEYLEIANTDQVGIIAKTDPDCSFSAVRDSFEMYNVSIHHNYLHDIGTEGMYVGSSFFLGHILSACDTTVLPHIISGVQVFSNRLENLGWDAIQVGSALGTCDIYDNYIYQDSQSEYTYQMSGIMINPGSSCNAYNNTIIDGKGSGIVMQGTGGQMIYNNLIINAGRTYDFEEQIYKQQFGIFCKYKYLQAPDSSFYFFNNTIINPKSDGIRFMNPESSGSYCANNLIINPGAFIHYDTNGAVNNTGMDSYIHNYYSQSDLTFDYNIFARSSKEQFFVDTLNYNYRLTSNSPAYNSGRDLLEYGIYSDIDNDIRPFDVLYDIGAYELQSASGILDTPQSIFDIQVYPNPIVNNINIALDIKEEGIYRFELIDFNGKTIVLETEQNLITKKYNYTFDISNILSGYYILVISNQYRKDFRKLIKVSRK